jgi:hypothetical protein
MHQQFLGTVDTGFSAPTNQSSSIGLDPSRLGSATDADTGVFHGSATDFDQLRDAIMVMLSWTQIPSIFIRVLRLGSVREWSRGYGSGIGRENAPI